MIRLTRDSLIPVSSKGSFMPAPQTYKNHGRFDPIFHMFLLPILLLNFCFSIFTTIRHWPQHPHLFGWWIVMSIALMILAFKARTYALKAQDRVIRLEERMRLAQILPASEHPRIDDISCAQLIALRFAPNEELAALAIKALDQNLAPKTIKASIINWRTDDHRV
jgi:hypothetical protein